MIRKAMLLSFWLAFTGSQVTFGKTSKEILEDSQDAVVYLAIRQVADGAEVSHGTGFLVTRDGYIATAAHVQPETGQYLDAVIGGKEGVHHDLGIKPVDRDVDLDVAIWRIQQSPACRQMLVPSAAAPDVGDRVEVIGFPGTLGLTPGFSEVQNLSGPDQEYVLQGSMEPGDSGGPVLNESGNVVGIFRGGHPSSGTENHVIPIGVLASLLKKHGLDLGSGAAPAFGSECYSICASPENGIADWQTKTPASMSSGWMSGGHGQQEVCGELQASWAQIHPGHSFLVNSMSENTKKDLLGHAEYMYHCAGSDVSGPVYRSARSAACGLWSRTGD